MAYSIGESHLARVVGPNRQAEILLVDDDPAAILVLDRMLRDMGRLRFATNGGDALQLANQLRPDLVLLDIEMPGMSGLDVCVELKADDALADMPVIFITSHHRQEDEVAGLAAGAVDFIAKPPLEPLVRARVQTHLRLKRFTDLLKQSAAEDTVTGISNRRVFEEQLPKLWLRALRENLPLTLLMIDVDFFKQYNDSLGHQKGDDCLWQVAHTLHAVAAERGYLLARYGGDEFVLVAHDLDFAAAGALAEELRLLVADLALRHTASPIAPVVSVSIGGATFDPHQWSHAPPRSASAVGLLGPSDLLLSADQALYGVKAAGRNQARVQGMTPPMSASDAGAQAGDDEVEEVDRSA